MCFKSRFLIALVLDFVKEGVLDSRYLATSAT